MHLCGGVLLSRRAVLTAGHCVDGRTDPCSWRAVLGAHNLQKHGPFTARRRIRRIIVHSQFKRETFENDVALFELRSAVRYSLYIQPMCLPPAALAPQLESNSSDCYISGWGRTAEKGTVTIEKQKSRCSGVLLLMLLLQNPRQTQVLKPLTHIGNRQGKTSSVLKEAQVGILPPSLCNSSQGYAGLVDHRALCAGAWAGGTDTCQGDSGGPLVCYQPDTDKYFLVGIASFGVGCGRPRYPGIYVRLSQYRPWIKAKLLLINQAQNPLSSTLSILLALAHTVLAHVV
ncbi:PREDICTED: transmembrane protease serine 12 isoform X1 [Ficedula albicollis]|uniref:transmembrane protease serine 12 isoform X1 n=1 Tax=Ficedula albicollis TaxID=59894 RepID=UPI000359D9CD|nr:PREDICTED: transmembrane protease serine 12 isoform X1 [Ficedula albicollis]XP_005062120.1 PREDICTED: transmembrane protease serine 12 isoform X1 [Ficedula albicollis]